jgi:RNA recognition motif-containing protein
MNIHVSNISFHTTEDTLNEMFSVYGTVKAIKIVKSGQPGEKAFGFVEMNSHDAAREAVDKLDGKEIQGRPLKVAIAKDSFVHASRRADSRSEHTSGNGSMR